MRLPRRLAIATSILPVVVVASVSVAPAADTEFTFALLGDVPYSHDDIAAFPDLVADVNNDVDVALVAHAGDIKSGKEPCTDEVLAARFDAFQQFEDPFWMTPGDNEWTDCLDPTPAFSPLDRLHRVRAVFYPDPTRTIGGSTRAVESQATSGSFPEFVEHTRFRNACVTFGTVHQVGSGNGSIPWKDETAEQETARRAEMADRNEAAAAWVDEIFDAAEDDDSAAVFVMIHARQRPGKAHEAVRERLIARTTGFDGPVVVANGDEHEFVVDEEFLGVENLTRWQTIGGPGAVDRWTRVDVDCSTDRVFSQRQVDVGTTPATTASTTTTATVPPSAPTDPVSVPFEERIERSAAASDRAVRVRRSG